MGDVGEVKDRLESAIDALAAAADISTALVPRFKALVRMLVQEHSIEPSIAFALSGPEPPKNVERSSGALVRHLSRTASELYSDRDVRRENPEQFILRVYGDPKETGMIQADLAKLDPKLHRAYRDWKRKHTPTIKLLTRDHAIADLSAEARLERIREQVRERVRRHKQLRRQR